MRLCLAFLLLSALAFGRTEFWAPRVPPRAQYTLDVRIQPDASRLEGTAVIRFRNETARPIGRLALQWSGALKVRINGVAVEPVPGASSPSLFELPGEAQPGERVEVAAEFSAPFQIGEKDGNAMYSYIYPRLWWGFATHDDFEVRLQVPPGYELATSGRLDAMTGTYRAQNVRAFGLFIGKGYESLEADAGDVRVRVVFTPKGRPCAELLARSAVDAIGVYRQRFGIYPHRSLSIVPGMDSPAGGYPAATALVVVHGQERLAERPEAFWRWITAHEIGHQYWSEHVLGQGPENLSWLMIGLGVYVDREYRRARAIPADTGAQWPKYVRGVEEGLDTTIDVTGEQSAGIQWDFNNVVTHGKSTALLNALEGVIGAKTFEAVHNRCLREYAGRRLGWREFQRLCELEGGQDLDWFFEQWARTSKSAMFRMGGQECRAAGSGFDCTVKVERTGTMVMPVTVAARFADGSEQRARTDRLAGVDTLHFHARAELKEAVLEPDSAVALAEPPAEEERLLRSKVRDMPYTGAGALALEAYRQTQKLKIEDAGVWRKLALTLYDGRYYEEAQDALAWIQRNDKDARFLALVWEGHILDLLGKRSEAVGRYQEAGEVRGSPRWQVSQYELIIDKAYVKERLKTPFVRR